MRFEIGRTFVGRCAHHYVPSAAQTLRIFGFKGSYGIMVSSRDSRARLTNLGSKPAQSSLPMWPCVCVCSVMSYSLRLHGLSLPGSSVHGIFQARVLEWVAMSSSKRSSWPRVRAHVSRTGRRILYHWEALCDLGHTCLISALQFTHLFNGGSNNVYLRELQRCLP